MFNHFTSGLCAQAAAARSYAPNLAFAPRDHRDDFDIMHGEELTPAHLSAFQPTAVQPARDSTNWFHQRAGYVSSVVCFAFAASVGYKRTATFLSHWAAGSGLLFAAESRRIRPSKPHGEKFDYLELAKLETGSSALWLLAAAHRHNIRPTPLTAVNFGCGIACAAFFNWNFAWEYGLAL